MFIFRKIWHALLSCNTRLEIRAFALLLTVNHSSSIFDLVVMYSHN